MTKNAYCMYLITLKVFKICLKMLAPIAKVNDYLKCRNLGKLTHKFRQTSDILFLKKLIL
jgi:hypothetical protein